MSELQSEQVGVAAAGDEENSETVLIQYIKEREEKIKVKQELRARNQPGNVDSLRLSDERMQKLDSSIKKVTSYIKRLKTLTESQKDALAKDMQQLNLTKYLSEVATAFTEAKLKMNDLACAIHLCSMLHQSYAEFRTCLFEQWQKVLTLKKDEKVQNPSKMRVDLRFFAELITINVLPSKEALSLLGNQLTILTTFDKDFSNISIIISFLKVSQNLSKQYLKLILMFISTAVKTLPIWYRPNIRNYRPNTIFPYQTTTYLPRGTKQFVAYSKTTLNLLVNI